MWRAGFAVVYAAANAAAIALAGTAACGLKLQWYVALAVLAFAMATAQTLVIGFAGLRVSALRCGPAFLLPAAVAGVFVAGLQFFAMRQPPDNLLVV